MKSESGGGPFKSLFEIVEALDHAACLREQPTAVDLIVEADNSRLLEGENGCVTEAEYVRLDLVLSDERVLFGCK